MSKLLDLINQQREQQQTSGITPTRSGNTPLDIHVGPDEAGNEQPVRFPVIYDGEPSEGLVVIDRLRLIGAHCSFQTYKNENQEAEPRLKNGVMTDGQLVLDTTCVARGRIRLIDPDSGEEIALPLETDVWPNMGNPMLFLYGQHQGATQDGCDALNEILMAHGWQARTQDEVEGERQRVTRWNLQPKGNVLPEQVKLPNGALEVTDLTVRSTFFTRKNGQSSGFKDFVTASFENHARWLKYRLASVDNADATKVVDRAITSITGGRTQLNEATKKLETYPDRAGVANFTVVTGREATGEPTETTAVSVWPSGGTEGENEANLSAFDQPF